MQLLIVRHAETVWNVQRRIQGWADSKLTAQGTHQAQALAERLRTYKLHAIYCSDAGRAQITAECIGLWHDHIEIMPLEELRETSWGEWEGMTADEISAKWPDEWQKFLQHGRDAHAEPGSAEGKANEADWDTIKAVPGGETMAEVSARISRGLKKVHERHKTDEERVLVVGHGGSLRFLFTDALHLRPMYARRFHLDNTSLSEIWYMRGQSPVLHLLNDISHIVGAPAAVK